MGRIFLLLMIIVPALEIVVFILAGNWIGIWPTFGLIVLTGIIGAWLAKKEGLQAYRRAQLKSQQGMVPGEEMLDGVCILIGGLLLLTPGFLTDTVGFLLLLPPTRKGFKQILQRFFQKMASNGNFIYMNGMGRKF
ncbi:membrane protein FxsA [Paenalkalicoccus suaedae]|uniref:Membrane protein FxsA n=1 Tax=Paenalkalicoccus suaedae TaxID=2592382 RepID=A0A859FIH4_9BACI|nr:FxsA family protein [Paenalkalicoccus suaedae]QKS72035.1 membrane protein FxsA [Paenalkalicoccus suaedae]